MVASIQSIIHLGNLQFLPAIEQMDHALISKAMTARQMTNILFQINSVKMSPVVIQQEFYMLARREVCSVVNVLSYIS